MKKNSEFTEILARHAELFGKKTAFIELSGGKEVGRIDYSALFARTVNLGEELRKQGLAGKLSVLYFPAGIDAIVTLMACFHAGVIPIARTFAPGSEERFKFQFHSLLQEIGSVVGVISTAPILKLICNQQGEKLKFFDIENRSSSVFAEACDRIEANYPGVAFVQLTSGSTARAKGVKISFDNLLYNLKSCRDMWQVDSDSVTVTWAPHSHIFGLVTGLLLPIYTGSTSVIIPPSDFSKDPLSWIEAISRYRGTHSGAPNFAYETCASKYSERRMRDIRLDSWQVAGCGGETVKQNTLNNFSAKFSDHGFDPRSFCPSYGMSENSGVVCSVRKSDPGKYCVVNREALLHNRIEESETMDEGRSIALTSMGEPPDGTEIFIVNPNTLSPLVEGLLGEIVISSPSLPLGYIEQSLDAEFIVLKDRDGIDKRFFRTGDIGFIKTGSLFVTGRLKEVIIIKGKNYSPYELERCATHIKHARILGSNAAFSVLINSQEVAVLYQETNRKLNPKQQNEVKQQLLDKIKQYTKLDLYDVILIDEGEIPKTASGKVKRMECRDHYLERKKSIESKVGQA
ncbi:MAG: AMP-binding protein [Alphaproteobacteria bacterium]|nr:AMP-binding protein [Alphaproteobacteria bacterium]